MKAILRSPMLRLVASLFLLCAVLWLVDAQALFARLGGADWRWLLLTFALLHAVTILQALRWCVTARKLGLDASPGHAIGEYYLAQIVNQTLPGGAIGDVARAVRARQGKDWTTSAQSVVIERALGQVAMISLGIAGLCIAMMSPGGTHWPTGLILGLLGGVAAFGLLSFGLGRLLPRNITGALQSALLSPGMPALQTVLSLSGAALTIGAFWATAKSTGTHIAASDAGLLIPLILSAMLVPLGIAGWGWREGAAAALFPMIGAGADAGVAAGLAYGTLLLTASLPGALWPLLNRLEPGAKPSNS